MLLNYGANIKAVGINDYSALHVAVENKNSLEVLQLLLDNGADTICFSL